jgi:hypothetical protein
MSTLVEPIAQEAIQSYKESITFLAENEIDYRFLNSGVTHATIVISRIFKHAKKNVVLYAKVLSGDISNREEVRQQIIHFLEKKDTKLHIVIDDVTRHDNGICKTSI